MDQERLLERFLRYVRIDTTANGQVESYPSSAGQWELGKLLVEELRSIGLLEVRQDEHGLVWATIPATTQRSVPVVALNSHLDTSPETSGADIQPNVIRDYRGGDIVLPGDSRHAITVAENPELDQLHGCTLVTSDGTTLLGGDDKAGIAVIVETAAYLMEHPEIEHGEVRILFTCDEEIGRGVKYVDLDQLGATACYTLDGYGAGDIDVETFSADLATVTLRGVNIHPSIAKNRMVNAVRAAGEFVARLPRQTMAPESTDGHDGFIHPYLIDGGVAEATVRVILRDFDTNKLSEQARQLRQTAEEVERLFPGLRVEVDVNVQYRNMREGLDAEPRAVGYAVEAHKRLGRTPNLASIRGGTDGAMLTEQGLPTPNLSTGQHNPHSPLEWVCLDEMKQAAEHVVELVQVWASEGRG
jgi:tripeptide aminopeptidase